MPVRHHRRKTPVTILAVSIGLALQMGAAVHAQEAAQTTESGQTTPAEGTVDTLDTVSVTGYRASVERALDIKRGEAALKPPLLGPFAHRPVPLPSSSSWRSE